MLVEIFFYETFSTKLDFHCFLTMWQNESGYQSTCAC